MVKIIQDIAKTLNVTHAKSDAQYLLSYVLQVERDQLPFVDKTLTKTQKMKLKKLIDRRNNGTPLEYVINSTQFYGFNFFITSDVLIPRVETEILVENVLKVLKPGHSVLDMGSGSGCIGMSVALSKKSVRVHAIERSDAAVQVIKKNFLLHNPNNFSYERIDVLDFEGLNYDCVVANPPYVSYLDDLESCVKDHEPWEALFSGMSGLECIDKWSKLANNFLKPDGLVFFEIGDGQSDKARDIFRKNGFYMIESLDDLSRTPRVIKAKKCKK